MFSFRRKFSLEMEAFSKIGSVISQSEMNPWLYHLGCVTLGKLTNLSALLFPHLYNEDDSRTYLLSYELNHLPGT